MDKMLSWRISFGTCGFFFLGEILTKMNVLVIAHDQYIIIVVIKT